MHLCRETPPAELSEARGLAYPTGNLFTRHGDIRQCQLLPKTENDLTQSTYQRKEKSYKYNR